MVQAVTSLLSDEDYRLYYGRHAAEVLHENQESTLQRLLKLLQPYLPPKEQ